MKIINPFSFILFFLILSINTTYSQENQEAKYKSDADSRFKVARDSAFAGNRVAARDSLNSILLTSPNYHDIRIMLGRTYAWDKEHDKAREAFNIVLEKTKTNADAWKAAIDNELWAKEFEKALALSEEATTNLPNDIDLKYRKAKSLKEMGKTYESQKLVDEILKENPEHAQTLSLERSFFARLSYNGFSLQTAVDQFSEVYGLMQNYYIQVNSITPYGSLIGRVNITNRFNKAGTQYEIDMFPRIVKGMYGYLNYGFSASSLYSNHRVGAELFKSLPHSTEASLGFRYLNFGSGKNTVIYTGSFSWYKGNYLFIIRPNITPQNLGFSRSGSFQFRKYGASGNDFIVARIGIGYSFELPKFPANNIAFSEDDVFYLNSQSYALGWQFTNKSGRQIWLPEIEYANQQVSFGNNKYVQIYSASLTWRYKM